MRVYDRHFRSRSTLTELALKPRGGYVSGMRYVLPSLLLPGWCHPDECQLIAEGTIMDCLLGDDEDRHPIDLVSEIFPPTCLVSAGSDELVPKEQSRNFHDKLVAKGVITALFEQPGAPHSFTGFRANGPGSECWIKVLEPACSFLVHHARQ